MRVLVIGAGGVGMAVARTAARWRLFERVVVADYDGERAKHAAAAGGDRFVGHRLDASDTKAVEELIRSESCDAVLNAVDPRFVMPIFRAALAAGVTYLDMAMSLSHPHPSDPYHDARREARGRAVRPGRRVGEAGAAGPVRHRRRARPLGRIRPLRGRQPLLLHR